VSHFTLLLLYRAWRFIESSHWVHRSVNSCHIVVGSIST